MIAISEQSRETDNPSATPCPVFGSCGGCSYHDKAYEAELKIKEEEIAAKIRNHLDVAPGTLRPIVASPKPLHYRQRIDLKLQRTREGVLIGYTPKEGHGILAVEQCPIALEPINAKIAMIKESVLGRLPVRYNQANITVRTGDDGRVVWGGIGRGSLKMSEQDYLWTEINGRRIHYGMDTFFQANLSILPALIATLRRLLEGNRQAHLFDLYGGVGLFSIGLYDLFKQVTLIEKAAASVACARYNQRYLAIDNMHIIEGCVESHLDALLADEKAEGVAIIDPPRAGLSGPVRTQLAKAALAKLVYLSCNPDALVVDLKELTPGGWRVASVTPFDFFPRTKHIETLVILEKTHGRT
jgi:23S rRNA (uracil1939-C5)-methyltransferase/tRNA (uracil-5-)-methyltransferase